MAAKKSTSKIINQGVSDGTIKMDNYISTELMKKVKGEVVKRNGMKKMASGLSVGPGTYYNPLYTPTSLQLPRDRKQVNVWSFSLDTKIQMADGTEKLIQDICVGDLVRSGNGNIRPVTHTFISSVEKDMYTISTSQNSLSVTHDHLCYVIDDTDVDDVELWNLANKVKEKTASEINEGDWIFRVIPVGTSKITDDNSAKNLVSGGNVTLANKKRVIIKNGLVLEQIKKIESKLFKGDVYDLTVDVDFNVIANSMCVRQSRHYFETEPICHSVINLYASLPITEYSVECPNPYYRKFGEDMLKRLQIVNFLQGVSLEYWKIGDCFILGELNDEKKDWERFVVLNPDQIEVKTNVLVPEPTYQMIPGEDLKNLVFNQEPKEQYNQLKMTNPDIIMAIRAGKNIDLDLAHVTHLKYCPTPYGTYGIPLLKCVFKTLMYKEMIRRAQFTIAERYVMPLKIFKLGTIDELPEQHEIDAMQEQLTMLMNDPTMVMVTHARFAADWQGIAGKTLQLNGEYSFIETELICGLGVSRAFLDGCVDVETEILTRRGFLKYHELDKENDLVARVNNQTYEIEWVVPESYFEREHNGDMYHFRTNKIDMLLSAQHKMWVRYGDRRKIAKDDGEWHFESGLEVFKHVGIHGSKSDRGTTNYPIQNRSTINHSGVFSGDKITIDNVSIEIEDFLAFAGYYVRKGSHAWCLNHPSLFTYFSENFHQSDNGKLSAANKSVPTWIKDLPPHLLNIFLEAVIRGDGTSRVSTKKKETKKIYKTYSTVSRKLADDMYEIGMKLGYSVRSKCIIPGNTVIEGRQVLATNRKPIYTINFANGSTRTGGITGHYPELVKQKHANIEQYNGIIWCPSVGGSELFIARRNGLMFISGNSGPTYSNASIGGNAFLQKVENFRNMLKRFVEDKIFKPIAILNDWYDTDPDTDEKFLVVPEFKWDALRLQDELSRQQILMQLRQVNLVSARTTLDSLHINSETEAQLLMEERDTIYDANRIMARQMMIQMAVNAQAQKQMMDMQMAMTPQQPGGMPMPGGVPGPADAAGGGVNVGGGMIGGDDLQGLPGANTGMSGLPAGSGFAPAQKATSKPPIAATLLKIEELQRKIEGILDESK